MDTIKQKSVAVPLVDGKSVTVRRMKWKKTREFLRLLAAVAIRVHKDKANPPASVQAFVESVVPELLEILTQSEELLAHLVLSSSDLKSEELDELDTMDALALVKASISVNYDAELKNCFAGFGESLAMPKAQAKTT